MNAAIKLAKIIPLTERQIGTAKNISEMMRNFQVRRQGQGVAVTEAELEALESSVRDLLANRVSIILGKLRKQPPSSEIEQLLLDLLK